MNVRKHHNVTACAVATVAFLSTVVMWAQPALAQGSIFGTVRNADFSTPPDSAVLFMGFLNNTDNEIRLQICDGAGYETGNWFDDFQNYLDEAPGIPYTYLFYNIDRGEFFNLSSTVPSNSFQQENVALAPATLVPRPSNVTGRALADTAWEVSWQSVAAATYHLYRRVSSSGGSFFRIDDPDGLSMVGLSDTIYVDSDIVPGSGYTYLVVAVNGSGDFSPPSDTSVSGCCIGVVGNANGDALEEVDIADLTYLVNYLFVTFVPPPCLAEGNITGDPAGEIDIADLTRLVNYLFVTFEPLPACQN